MVGAARQLPLLRADVPVLIRGLSNSRLRIAKKTHTEKLHGVVVYFLCFVIAL